MNDFDYKNFALKMQEQARELIPAGFRDEEKQYMLDKITDFVNMTGEKLCFTSYDSEQKAFLCQVIAEWTFHKVVDLVKAKVPKEYWDEIMQKIAFTIYEFATQGFDENPESEYVLKIIELQVKKVYLESIRDLPLEALQKMNLVELLKLTSYYYNLKSLFSKVLHILLLLLIGFAGALLVFRILIFIHFYK